MTFFNRHNKSKLEAKRNKSESSLLSKQHHKREIDDKSRSKTEPHEHFVEENVGRSKSEASSSSIKSRNKNKRHHSFHFPSSWHRRSSHRLSSLSSSRRHVQNLVSSEESESKSQQQQQQQQSSSSPQTITTPSASVEDSGCPSSSDQTTTATTSTNNTTVSKRSSRRSSSSIFRNVGHAVDKFFHSSSSKSKTNNSKKLSSRPAVRPRVFVHLYGCKTDEEHWQKIEDIKENVRDLHGEDGLRIAGFEYRRVFCKKHEKQQQQQALGTNNDTIENWVIHEGSKGEESYDDDSSDEEKKVDSSLMMSLMEQAAGMGLSERSAVSARSSVSEQSTEEDMCGNNDPIQLNATQTPTTTSAASSSSVTQTDNKEKRCYSSSLTEIRERRRESEAHMSCIHCTTRLYHIESNTLITDENRQHFIADRQMYEEIARLCQENAQEIMQREGSLEWVTICNDEAHGEQPIRALVHYDHHLVEDNNNDGNENNGNDLDDDDDEEEEDLLPKPTLLIATGKGKVRAGIFSRKHLMTSGIEPSTALPMVIEGNRRNMNVVLVDPNARGDRQGGKTFDQSLGALFGHWEEDTSNNKEEGDSDDKSKDFTNQKHDLYIVAHSASGAQVVQYLLDRSQQYLPRIRAIAFTDSTHSIQWAKNNANLSNFLESSACVYVKSANEDRDSDWQKHKTGDKVRTDQHWHHRFGDIQTLWAGTNEHSMSNWFAHSQIWDHFDRHLHTGGQVCFFDNNSSRNKGGEE